MPSENKHTGIQLIEQLLRTVESLGIDETAKLLASAESSSLSLADKRVEFVLKMISVEFRIPIEEMINSYSKSTKRKFSIMFGVYYLHGSFQISFGDLEKIYKRNKGLLCRYYHQIKKLSHSNSDQKTMVKYRDKFDLIITDFTINKNNK